MPREHFKRIYCEYILKTGSTGYIYEFSVDYWAIANDKILDLHNYLMKKNNIV